MIFGPPGFGENPKVDERMPTAILHLDRPAPVLLRDKMVFDSNKTIPGVLREVQLAATGAIGPGNPFNGRNPHVVVTGGILYMSDNAYSRTLVSYNDGSARISRASVCKGEVVVEPKAR